ncbi:hypothetical protein BH23ACT2_BH23ACT2_16100 [soil metagenome]
MTDPGTETPTDEVDAPTPPTEATPPAQPSAVARWARRGGVLMVVAAAVAILVWGNEQTESSLPSGATDSVVQRQQPLPGAIEPRQVDIGAELAIGYDGRVSINGLDIPEEQMRGARDPATVSADDLAEEGLRPNNRNRVFFRPGPGKVIESLPRGEVQITVTYFRDRAPEQDRGSTSWTITVN